MLNSFLQTLLTLTVAGTLLALLIFAIKPLLRGRVSSTFQYYLWLIVLLRLVLPIGSPVTVSNIFTVSTPSIEQTATVTQTPNFVATETQTVQEIQTAQNAQMQTPQTPQNAQNIGTPIHTAETQQNIDLTKYVPQIVFLLWLLGAITYFALHIIAYLRFVAKLGKTNEKADVADIAVLREMGGKRIKLYQNSALSTSILIGIFRPRIVVPKLEYVNSGEATELSNILRHELTHYRRADLLYKWFLLVVCAVQWCNPVMYFIKKEISTVCELACDEAVISNMTAFERQSYGQTLISAVRGNIPSAVLTTAMCARRTQIKERLINIMKFKKRSVLTTIICTILAITLTSCAAILGTPATTEQTDKKPVLTEDLAAPVNNVVLEIKDEGKQTDWGEFVAPGAKINETVEIDGVKIVFDGDVYAPKANYATAQITKKELSDALITNFVKEATGQTEMYSQYDRDVAQVQKMYDNWLKLSEKGIMSGNSIPSWKYSEINNPRIRTKATIAEIRKNDDFPVFISNGENVSAITFNAPYHYFSYMRDEFDIIQPKSMTDTMRVGKDDSKPQIDFLKPGEPNISQTEAQKIAEKYLALLEVDYKLYSAEPCSIFDSVLEKTTGWYMFYTREVGGLQAIAKNEGFGVNPTALAAGSPAWGAERCYVVVDKSGLVSLNTVGASQIAGSKPTTIMPFDMIKEKIANFVYTNTLQLNMNGQTVPEVKISGLELCTGALSYGKQTDKGMYTPMWFIRYSIKTIQPDKSVYWTDDSSTYFFSATTGELVDPRVNLFQEGNY